MTPTASALGAFAPFTFEGLALKLAPLTLGVQKAYEAHLVGLAFANLRAQRAALGDEYADERAALRRDVDAGEYDYGTDVARKSLRAGANLRHLIYLCLCEGHRDDPRTPLTPAVVDRLWASPEKLREVMDLMEEVNRDPNASPPVGPGAAGSPAGT